MLNSHFSNDHSLYHIKFNVVERKIKEIKDTLFSFEKDGFVNLAAIATEMNVVHAKALETLGILEQTFFQFFEENETNFCAELIKESSVKLKEILAIFIDRTYPGTKIVINQSWENRNSVLSGVVKVSLARTIDTIKSIIEQLAKREQELERNLPHEQIDTNELFTVASSERSTTRELDHLREDVKHISFRGERPVCIPRRYIEYCIGKTRIRENQSSAQIKEAIQRTRPRESTSFMRSQEGSAYWFPLPRIRDNSWYSLSHNTRDPLLNIRFQVDEGNPERAHLMVNTGSIDTKEKAVEYAWGLNYACGTSKRKRFDEKGERIFWHQLNSNSTEEKLIEDQNKISRFVIPFLEQHLNNPKIAHINLSLNFASILPWEDNASRKMNLEGWAQMTIWVLEDIKSAAPLILVEEATFLFEQLLEQAAYLENSKNLIHKAKDQQSPNVSQYQESLKKRLIHCSVLAYAIGTDLNFKHDNLSDGEKLQISKTKTLLLCLAYSLAMQTGTQGDLKLRTLSRVTEIEMHLLLDMMLDCISTINCKSGLDRTGYIRACWDGLRTIWKQRKQEHHKMKEGSEDVCEALAYEDLLVLILRQDDATKTLDTIHEHIMLDYSSVDDLENLEKVEPVRHFPQLLEAKLKTRGDSHILLLAYKYQRLMLKHLFQVCMPLTFESSGTPGLKYGHKAGGLAKFFPNPHPLSRMPNFVETEDGRLIKLVDSGGFLNDLGRQFTTAACQLIHIMSEYREH